MVLLVLSFLSWLSPVEYDEDGNRSSRRKYADPVLKVIEKPCDLILKHMAVCFVSPTPFSYVLGGERGEANVSNRVESTLG